MLDTLDKRENRLLAALEPADYALDASTPCDKAMLIGLMQDHIATLRIRSVART
jgi:hypothetical protein